MLLPTINLVKSYQTLQSRRTLQVKYEKKSAQLKYSGLLEQCQDQNGTTGCDLTHYS